MVAFIYWNAKHYCGNVEQGWLMAGQNSCYSRLYWQAKTTFEIDVWGVNKLLLNYNNKVVGSNHILIFFYLKSEDWPFEIVRTDASHGEKPTFFDAIYA